MYFIIAQFAASEYNAIPQLGQANDSPRNPFSYQANQPSTYSVMPEVTETSWKRIVSASRLQTLELVSPLEWTAWEL